MNTSIMLERLSAAYKKCTTKYTEANLKRYEVEPWLAVTLSDDMSFEQYGIHASMMRQADDSFQLVKWYYYNDEYLGRIIGWYDADDSGWIENVKEEGATI